ncbi:hypothetical protein ACFL6M_01465 [Candidatus Eisenbacteria bacterium]|uniref:Uncharacterized protein n=1 Tax=Eiseniibacteriota bacterium TaxID=2212470 RepID=A0ABV6YIT7_UNCEI
MRSALLHPSGLIAGLLVTATVAGAAPLVVNYQGILTNAVDQPIHDSVDLTFRIYPDSLPDTPELWTEAHNDVEVTNGLFNVLLGSVTSFPDDLFGAGERWLGIQVKDDPEIEPLIRFTSVPWALHAAVADTALSTTIGSDDDWTIVDDDMYAAVPGKVGIGTLTPRRNLEVFGVGATAGIRLGTDYNVLVGDITHTGGSGGLVINSYAGGGGWADLQLQTNSVTRLFIESSGKIGLGTDTPAELLDVAGTTQTQALRLPTGAINGYVLTTDAAGNAAWQPGTGGGEDNDWEISGNNMYALPSGNVGIGETNPSSKLYVSSSARTLYAETTGNIWAINGTHQPTGNKGEIGGPTYGVRGKPGDNSNSGQLGTEDYGVLGEHGHGHSGYFASNTLGAHGANNNGNNGSLGSTDYGVHGEHNNGSHGYIGSTNYGIYGRHDTQFGVNGMSDSGTGVRGGTFTGVGVLGVDFDTSNEGRLGGDTYGVRGYSGFGTAVHGVSPGGHAGFFDGDVWVQNGRISTPMVEITGGSDLSEQFVIRASPGGIEPTPGLLVCLDAEQPGGLVVSTHAYDKRVAGIISGAGGVSPGLLMGQKGSQAYGTSAVALTGRVYCWADASHGAITTGDLLTTSSTAGHAMKATDHDRAYGAVIGKAMTSLASGTGLVLVLVNLQ